MNDIIEAEYMKRLFIAVPVEERSRTEIAARVFSDENAKKMPVRWTPVQNLHLTLQFLGDTEEKRIPVLKQILNRIPQHEIEEKLVFTDIGAFPDLSSPRIIWLGIAKNQTLLNIRKRISDDLTRNGFEFDKKGFKAHLTLGRVRDGVSVSAEQIEILKNVVDQSPISPSCFDRITLFESQLRPGGPLYTGLYDKILFQKES